MSRRPEKKLVEVKAVSHNFALWMLFLLFAAPTLTLVINVNDSTFLKGPLLHILGALTLAVWLMVKAKQRSIEIQVSVVHLLLGGYLIASAISLHTALSLRHGVQGLIFLASSGLTCWLSFQLLTTPLHLRGALLAFLFVASIVTLLGLLQVLAPIDAAWLFITSNHAAIGTFGNTTYFGSFIAMSFPLLIGLALRKGETKIVRLISWAVTIGMLYLLVQTGARSAWIASVVSMIVMTTIYYRSWRHRIFPIAAIAACVALLFLVFPELIMKRLGNLFELDPSSSFARRLFFYDAAWRGFLSSPFLGNGVGNFVIFLPKFRSPDYWKVRSEDIVAHAHNEFLEILSETGVFGFLFFGAIIAILMYRFIKALRTDIEPGNRLLIISSACAILALLIDSFASMSLRTIPIALLFWFLVGVSARITGDTVFSHHFTTRSWTNPVLIIITLMGIGGIALYLQHLSSRYKAEKLFLEGNVFRWSNEPVRAAQKYEQALLHDGDLYEARLYVGANDIEVGNFTKALKEIKILLEEHPYFPKARIISAIASYELGDSSTAHHFMAIERTISTSPQTMFYQSVFAQRAGRNAEAVSLILERLRSNVSAKIPDFAEEGIRQLGTLLGVQTIPPDYLTVLKNLEDTFPRLNTLLVSIGETYEQAGMPEQARDVIIRINLTGADSGETRTRVEQLQSRLQ